ncbi:hypothetical protein [Nocardia sp. NBC_01388]|uniref:hypothetical protein n=1 Tax=Nocardia sp. NBC_01388 TaxID=2903596 RepID=UPI0032455620
MNGRTLSRRAASAAAIAATAVLGATGAAGAEPAASPIDTAIAHLTDAAGPDQDALAAVNTTAKAAELISAAKLANIAFAPFGYQAPTLGCGFNMPFTMTVASAESGESGPDRGIAGPPGTLRFQATPGTVGMPLASGLSVAWLNVANGRSGINALDDQTDYNLPALSKTIDSGPGTVIASLWGSVDYPGSRCVVLPTVGLFTVADLPKDPPAASVPTTQPNAVAPQPGAAAPQPGTGQPATTAPSAPAAQPNMPDVPADVPATQPNPPATQPNSPAVVGSSSDTN